MGEHAKPYRKSVPIIGLAGAVAAVGLFGITESAKAADCPTSGSTVVCTYDNPDAADTFVVPAGVTSVTIRLQGGSGGDGTHLIDGSFPPLGGGGGGVGGPGGITEAPVNGLIPGETLGIFVGGTGGPGLGCDGVEGDGGDGGVGGKSGGQTTGGTGGDGLEIDYLPGACAGGGGGGGSYVMRDGKTPTDIVIVANPGDPADSTGAEPVLVAGGGGGGGGGLKDGIPNDGGYGGGTESGLAEPGDGGSSQEPESQPVNEVGGEGQNGFYNNIDNANARFDAGGGGGGGYQGGIGGATFAGGPFPDDSTAPGAGGNGGEYFPQDVPGGEAIVPSASLPASAPALEIGPVTRGVATADAPGEIKITYTAPSSPPSSPAISPTDTDDCQPSDGTCVVKPPAGKASEFVVTGFGGSDGATLVATLNGGKAPTCNSVGGILAPDWVQFGFVNPRDGKTWSKKIQETGTIPTSKTTAQHVLAQTQICFAAPYKFVVKRGETLKRIGGRWEGLLAHCKSRIVAEAKAEDPDLARPCILNRQVVQKGDGWVVRVNYFVPNGELDPQGRSLRKKKKKRN